MSLGGSPRSRRGPSGAVGGSSPESSAEANLARDLRFFEGAFGAREVAARFAALAALGQQPLTNWENEGGAL